MSEYSQLCRFFFYIHSLLESPDYWVFFFFSLGFRDVVNCRFFVFSFRLGVWSSPTDISLTVRPLHKTKSPRSCPVRLTVDTLFSPPPFSSLLPKLFYNARSSSAFLAALYFSSRLLSVCPPAVSPAQDPPARSGRWAGRDQLAFRALAAAWNTRACEP